MLGILINAVLLFPVNPAVIAERADNEEMRRWDQLWGDAGLRDPDAGDPDRRRAGLPLWLERVISRGLHLTGVGLFFIGGLLFAWAMAFNAKFATVVRVGDEDSHPVATDGPYRIVRHPGYLGACFQRSGRRCSLARGGRYRWRGVDDFAVIVRTALEDKTLQEELPGYEKLVAQTKYRLFPGVW